MASVLHPNTKGMPWFVVVTILVIMVAVTVSLALVLPPDPKPTFPQDLSTEPTPTPLQVPLIDLISSASSDGGLAIADWTMPQNQTLEWLAGNLNLVNYTDLEKIQRYALATLYLFTQGDTSWNNTGNWLSNEDVCNKWNGSLCSRDGAVSHLKQTC
jgi:hypothetical protein